MRLIDADKLHFSYVQEVGFEGQMHCVVRSLEIKEAPIVDAVPVVRCKDCKHRPLDNYEEPTGEDGLPDYVCPYICSADNWYTGIPDDDSFCDKGERKDGEQK